ncbi:UNVERIFIED_CONTAM: Tryptophan synthase beta chain 1, chloroplastic [Sesamum radiatum]|uniref:tryptophan synthase n=1 Tax=Sesamum radiatum TaxID=300843 RepID=A0AAW2T308_SESRA
MTCCQHLLAVSFRHANAPSISKPKFAPKLHFNCPSRTNIENKDLITCSAIGHMRASIDHHIAGLHDTHPAGRTSEVLRLIDETEEGLLSTGKFGRFGGMFVPETLIYSLNKLLAEFIFCLRDPEFQGELAVALRDYVGRETPLYFAQRLTDHYINGNGEGPEIYLKREDLNHGGAHKINNAIAQAMLAKRMGLKRVVAATGAGAHGVATAAACAKLSLDCSICMGKVDEKRQPYNVLLMKLLGAQVKSVEGTFKDATSEAIRSWVGDLDNSYYLDGSAVGPHPCPSMVREFQSVIGKEIRKQAMEKWGGKPDVLVACVGSGSNALGMFHEFVRDEDVRLIGVEAAGIGIDRGKHSATLSKRRNRGISRSHELFVAR